VALRKEDFIIRYDRHKETCYPFGADRLPRQSMVRWVEFFRENPEAGNRLVDLIRPFDLEMSLLDALGRDLTASSVREPRSEEEAALLSSVAVDAFLHRRSNRARQWNDHSLKLCSAMNHISAVDTLNIAYGVVDTLWWVGKRSARYTRYRKHLWGVDEHQCSEIEKYWLSRVNDLGAPNLRRVTARITSVDMLKTAAEMLGIRELKNLSAVHEPFFWALMDEENLNDCIRANPEMGQLVLGNLWCVDKSKVVKTWLSRFQHVIPKDKLGHYYTTRKPILEGFNPFPALCDIRNIPDKFWSDNRVYSFACALKDLPQVTAVVTPKLAARLKESENLAEPEVVCDYEQLKEDRHDSCSTYSAILSHGGVH